MKCWPLIVMTAVPLPLGAEAALSPAALVAFTVKVYAVPLVRLVTAHDVPLVVQVPPLPPMAVTV